MYDLASSPRGSNRQDPRQRRLGANAARLAREVAAALVERAARDAVRDDGLRAPLRQAQGHDGYFRVVKRPDLTCHVIHTQVRDGLRANGGALFGFAAEALALLATGAAARPSAARAPAAGAAATGGRSSPRRPGAASS